MNRCFHAFALFVRELFLSMVSSPLLPVFLRRYVLKICLRQVGSSVYVNPHVIINKTNISIGDFAVISKGAYLDGSGYLEVGDRVHIGPKCLILTGTHSIMPSVFRRDRADNVNLETVIERGVWIGGASVVLPGVRISEGCVIAAGSVVVKSCSQNALYAGVPAKFIKELPVVTDRPFFKGEII